MTCWNIFRWRWRNYNVIEKGKIIDGDQIIAMLALNGKRKKF